LPKIEFYEFLLMQFSAAFCYVLPFKSKYSQQGHCWLGAGEEAGATAAPGDRMNILNIKCRFVLNLNY
jgi:hypothetical protein